MKQLGNQIIVSLFNEKLMFDTLSLGKLILLFLQLTYRSLADIDNILIYKPPNN